MRGFPPIKFWRRCRGWERFDFTFLLTFLLCFFGVQVKVLALQKFTLAQVWSGKFRTEYHIKYANKQQIRTEYHIKSSLEIRGGFKFRNSQFSLSSYSSTLCISPINTCNLKGKMGNDDDAEIEFSPLFHSF